MVTHLPLVPSAQSRMWSMAALAAEAAEEAPRASMMAAPRLPTFGMYSLRYQASSLTACGAGWPATVAKRMSGYMVGEWLPQTIIFSMSVTALPVRVAICEVARL
jgi:hypothetical protein